MLHTIERAVQFYQYQPEIWKKLQYRGMNGDYSWTHSAGEYLKLYNRLFEKKEKKEDKPVETNPVIVEIKAD